MSRHAAVAQALNLADTGPIVDAKHLNWGAQALWQQLEPMLPGLCVEVQQRLESTNSTLLDRARHSGGRSDARVSRPGDLDALSAQERTPLGRRSDDTAPCLLVAEQQTRGRGRLGRDWVSSAGASLTFSLLLPMAPQQWSGLSLAVGLALADALDPLQQGHAPRIGLKWPNDLWLMDGQAGPGMGRKLAGVLIETLSVGQRRMCVVGVGLNVLPQPVEGLSHGYACLQELDAGISAPAALARVALPLVQALLRFERVGFAPCVPAYGRRDLLKGLPVSTSGPPAVQGVADGVDESGALRVLSDGVHSVLSGEVSVRLNPSPGL